MERLGLKIIPPHTRELLFVCEVKILILDS